MQTDIERQKEIFSYFKYLKLCWNQAAKMIGLLNSYPAMAARAKYLLLF